MVLRFVLYLLGLWALALGNVLGVLSGLGVTATASFGYVLSDVFGISLGMTTNLTFLAFILIQLIATKEHNRIRILLQFPFTLLFGWFIDQMMAVIQIQSSTVWMQILLMVLGILATAFGAFATVGVQLVPTAPDGVVHTLANRFGFSFGSTKNGFDLLLVLLAAVFGLVFRSKLIGIGIGTVVSALLVGQLIKCLEKWCGNWMRRLVQRSNAKKQAGTP